MSAVWEWDGCCSRCHVVLHWEGPAPESKDEAMCHACEKAVLQIENESLRADLSRVKARTEELADALHIDRTGLAAALNRVVDVVKGRLWVTEGRGAYEWDDDRYREEAGSALREAMGIAIQALRDSGTVANVALNGKEPKPEGERLRARIAELEEKLQTATDKLAQVEGERTMLATGIGDALIAAKIIRDDVPGLTGPQLLMFLEELGTMGETLRPRVEAETVAAIVAWARHYWRAYDEVAKMLDAIVAGRWR